jgi:hypothetical protein
MIFMKYKNYFNDKSVENTGMDIPGNYKNKYRVKGTVSEELVWSDCDRGRY